MQDRPTAAELLRAVREHLERAILPQIADPKLKFQTLVCANVVSILEREVVADDDLARQEWASLRALQGAREEAVTLAEIKAATATNTRHLCRQIRAGEKDEGEASHRTFEHVRMTVRAKLAIANPRYASVR